MRKLYLDTPASPHIVVAPDRLAVSHKTKIHCRADELTVESKIHATHGEQGALWYCQHCINIPNNIYTQKLIN